MYFFKSIKGLLLMSLYGITPKSFIIASAICFNSLNAANVNSERNFFDLSFQTEEKMPANLYLKNCIIKTIQNSEKVTPLREGICDLLDALYQTGVVTKLDTDKNTRPYFVTLQGIVEQNLAFELKRGKIKNVVGIIHTPTPATPLCSEGEITEGLVHPSLIEDENRLFTIRARADTIRDFLGLGCTLYVVYPQGGLEKRTEEQKAIYFKALKEYSENLYDHVLSQTEMDHDMVGASYLFQDEEGSEYLFSLKAYQANDPKDDNTWTMWFGKTSEPEIAKRLSRVRQFLRESGGPEFELKKEGQL